MRDKARDQFRELKDNGTKLRQVLDGDGFDGLHRDGELVARNFDFLAETRDDASQIWERAGDAAEVMRRSMASTVRIVEQEIAAIESNPLLDSGEKQALIDSLVETTNAQLVGQNVAAAGALASQVAAHTSHMGSLPWHVSTADATPHTGNSSVQALNSGWKQSPPSPGDGTRTPSTTTGSKRPPTSNQPTPPQPETTSDGRRPAEGEGPPHQQPSTTSGGERIPAGGADVDSPAATATGDARPPATGSPGSPVAVPPMSGSGGGASGLGTSGGGVGGGLRPAGVAAPPIASTAPVTTAATSPAASSGVGTGGGTPRTTLPLAPASGPSISPPAAAPPAAVAAVSTPLPAASAPAAAVPAASGPVAAAPGGGVLTPAPALAGPPPAGPPAAAVPPSAPTAAPATPFHGPPLPPVGAPQITRQGVIEQAEDPDIVRARQVIWECLWHGRRYPMLDWAIGLHRGPTGTVFYLTSSEGAPYIPQHVHLPASPQLVTVFADRKVVTPGRLPELAGWLNPVATVVNHAALRDPPGSLWAVVSSVKAEQRHRQRVPVAVRFEWANPGANPLTDPTRAQHVPELTPGRRHRLAVDSPELWRHVQQMPPAGMFAAAVALAAAAERCTRDRATFTGLVVDGSALPTVDPYAGVLTDVLDQVQHNEPLDAEHLAQLRRAYMAAVIDAQRRRRTPHDFTDDTAYLDHYRRARAYEAAVLLAETAVPGPPVHNPALLLADIAYCALVAHPHQGERAEQDTTRLLAS